MTKERENTIHALMIEISEMRMHDFHDDDIQEILIHGKDYDYRDVEEALSRLPRK